MSLRQLAHRMLHGAFRQHHHHDAFHHWQPTAFFERDAFFRPSAVFTIIDAEPQGRRDRRNRHSASAAKQQSGLNMENQEPEYNYAGSTRTSNSNAALTNNNSNNNNIMNADQSDSRVSHQSRGGLSRRNRWHQHPLGWPAWNHHPLSFISPFTSLFNAPLAAAPEMAIDMFSSPQAYNIHASVPGIAKEDINITVEDGVLTIEAERREERKEPRSRPANNNTTNETNTANTANQIKINNATEAESENQTPATAATSDSAASSSSTSTTTPASSENKTDTAATSATTTDQAREAEEDDNEEEYDYIENTYGRVQRSFQLPEDVDVNGLTAKYEDGLIKIKLPRLAEKKVEKKQRINIQ